MPGLATNVPLGEHQNIREAGPLFIYFPISNYIAFVCSL